MPRTGFSLHVSIFQRKCKLSGLERRMESTKNTHCCRVINIQWILYQELKEMAFHATCHHQVHRPLLTAEDNKISFQCTYMSVIRRNMISTSRLSWLLCNFQFDIPILSMTSRVIKPTGTRKMPRILQHPTKKLKIAQPHCYLKNLGVLTLDCILLVAQGIDSWSIVHLFLLKYLK